MAKAYEELTKTKATTAAATTTTTATSTATATSTPKQKNGRAAVFTLWICAVRSNSELADMFLFF